MKVNCERGKGTHVTDVDCGCDQSRCAGFLCCYLARVDGMVIRCVKVDVVGGVDFHIDNCLDKIYS